MCLFSDFKAQAFVALPDSIWAYIQSYNHMVRTLSKYSTVKNNDSSIFVGVKNHSSDLVPWTTCGIHKAITFCGRQSMEGDLTSVQPS